MSISVPTIVSPVGGLLADLPFASAQSGIRLEMTIRTILEAQGDEHETTVMLHLLTQNGPQPSQTKSG